MYWNRWIGVVAIVAMGCTYVSPTAVQDKILTLDEDGDGVTKGEGDCDDFDAFETPGNPEIPYDGYDNDCSGDGDLVDIDGDGYPGILRADWEALNPKQPWPSDVVEDQLDCRDDPAVKPRASDIYPGAEDQWYDGDDANCDGDNDFDQDKDGYIRDIDISALAAYEKEWGYSFPEALPGDCDDSQKGGALVFPNNPAEDIPYDGIDTNCDGANDFDADNDGFSPSEYASAYEVYVNAYGYPSNFVGDDCLDLPLPLTGDAASNTPCAYNDGGVWTADPSCVYPGADDVVYDGIDADCLGDGDFDLDLDGFMPNGTETAYANYMADWDLDLGDGSFNDCDDDDPTRHPDALELLNDIIDQDCDGDTSTSPFDFGDFEYLSPGHVVVTSNDLDYLISTLAVEVTDTTTPSPSTFANTGVTMTFGPGATKNTPPEDVRYRNSDDEIGTGFDLVVPEGEAFLPILSELRLVGLGGEMGAFMNAFMYSWDGTSYKQTPLLNTADGISDPYDDIDLQIDEDGDTWGIACNLEGVNFVKNPNTANLVFDLQASITTSTGFDGPEPPQFGSECFIDFSAGSNAARGTLCDGANGCNSFIFDAISENVTVATEQPYADLHVLSARTEDNLQLLTLNSGGVDLTDTSTDENWLLLSGYTIYDADAVWHDDELYLAAIVEGTSGRDILVVNGNPDGTLSEVVYPYASHLVPASVGITTDAERMVLAASGLANDGSSDRLGWMFLGWSGN